MNIENNQSKYHCIINGIMIDDIEKCSIDGIIDSSYSSELIDNIESQLPSLKKGVCEDFSWDFVDDIKEYVDNTDSDKVVALYDINDSEIETFPLKQVLKDLCERYYADENGNIQAGRIWSTQLQTFIEQAEWIVALQSEKGKIITDLKAWPKPFVTENGGKEWKDQENTYTPILWYGIKDSQNSEKWTIGNDSFPAIVTTENGMGEYGSQMQIDGFELNYPLLFDNGSIESWYFGSFGAEGADFSKLLNECPINLHELIEMHDGKGQIANYCYKLQQRLSKKLLYICPNTEYPDTNSDKLVEDFWVPLYEDADLNEMYSVGSLMDDFSYIGEKYFYSVKVCDIEDRLVCMKSVDTKIVDYTLVIQFNFEDGKIYSKEIELEDESGDDENLYSYEQVDRIIKIIDASHKAAPHLFFLKHNRLKGDALSFEFERWG